MSGPTTARNSLEGAEAEAIVPSAATVRAGDWAKARPIGIIRLIP